MPEPRAAFSDLSRLMRERAMEGADETIEVVRFGGETRLINIGLQRVMARARARYISGEIDVRYFEAIMEWAVAREDEAR